MNNPWKMSFVVLFLTEAVVCALPTMAEAPQNTAPFRQRPRLTRPVESYNVHSRNSDQLWAPLSPGITETTRSESSKLPKRPNGSGDASTYDARPRRSDTARQPVLGVPETIQRRHSGSQLEASTEYLIGTAGRLGKGSQTREQLQAQLTALRSQLRQVTSKIHQQQVIVQNLERLVNTSSGSNRTTNISALTEATTKLQQLRAEQSQLEMNIHTIETKLSSHNR